MSALIYISNHPSTKEPPISHLVGNYMYSRFNYMASREVFDWGNGVVGNVIRNMGGFSVIAGTSDRESLKLQRAILAKPAGANLYYSLEGESLQVRKMIIYSPFQLGVSQLGFWDTKMQSGQIQMLT